jgi:hypothetical protein
MQVQATDGEAGTVTALVVDGDSSHVTHILMERGHLWGKKEVTVPLSAVDHVDAETVYLQLDNHALGLLPAVRLKHHWFEHVLS